MTWLLDASFLIDVLRGRPGARERAAALDASGEPVAIPAPALAEYLDGAYFLGGSYLSVALRLVAGRDVVPFGRDEARSAAQIRAELRKRGTVLPLIDAQIAATTLGVHGILLTRDSDFGRVPGLSVETY